MNARNSTSRRNNATHVAQEADEEVEPEPDHGCSSSSSNKNKTRKKREELSISATKSIKKETVEITVSFN
jgi:hypothetical protein